MQQPYTQQQPYMQHNPQFYSNFLPPVPPPQEQQQVQYIPVPLPPLPQQQAAPQTAPITPQQAIPVTPNTPPSIQEQLAGFTSFVDTIKSAAMQLGIANPTGNAQEQQQNMDNSEHANSSNDENPFEGMPFRVVKTPGWNFAYDNETGKPMDWLTTAFVNGDKLGGIVKIIGSKWEQMQQQIAQQQGGPTPTQMNEIQAMQHQMRQLIGQNRQLREELEKRSNIPEEAIPDQINRPATIAEPPPIESRPNNPRQSRSGGGNVLLGAIKRNRGR